MRINVAVPEAHVEKPVLDAALESVTRLNESMLSRSEIPTFRQGLKSGIEWKPEPPGAEHFDHAKTVLARKWGDCDDLAPWHAASLRHSGEDPDATAVVRRSGPKTWHAVVQRSDGAIDDPSREAGMGRAKGVSGAVVPIMFENPHGVSGAYIVRPKIAMRPVRGAVQARADMPWHWREHLDDEPTPTDYAMTTLHTAPVAQTALVGALDGACELAVAGGYGDPEHVDRLCCIADAVAGADYGALAEVYGEEHAQAAQQVVGSFFGKIAKGFGSVVKAAAPFASKALQFVPGVGPIASTALDMGMKMIPSGGGGARPAAAPVQIYQPQGVQAYKPPPGSPYTPPGAAATLFPAGGGRLRPGGAELLRSLIYFD
jgi:hypothetical protein